MVLRKVELHGAGKVLAEAGQHLIRGRALPLIDGLVEVDGQHEACGVPGQGADDPVLGQVRVLHLVDLDELEAMFPAGPDVGPGGEGGEGHPDEVGEVEGMVRRQGSLVGLGQPA